MSGTLSNTIISPIGIQSFLGNKSWTLNSGASVQDRTFSASFTNVVPSFDISHGSTNLVIMNRNIGSITLNAGTSMFADVAVGKSLGVIIVDAQGQKLQMNYRMEKVKFYQVSSLTDITSSGMYIIGNGLRLEPATLLDTSLRG